MEVRRFSWLTPLFAAAVSSACTNSLDELSTVKAGVGSSVSTPTSAPEDESSCEDTECASCTGARCSSAGPDAGTTQNSTTGLSLALDSGVAPGVSCGPGTFSAVSDGGIQCRACPEGSFSSIMGAKECAPWTDCEAGSFIKSAGSTTKDRECERCPDGETSAVNANTCSAVSCEVGAAKNADGACVECEAGNYCEGGVEPLVACGDTNWDDDSDPTTPCVDKATCVAGQFVGNDGDGTVNRTCMECGANTFSTTENAPECAPFSTCEAGTYVLTPGTNMQDTTCMACAPGTFSSGEDALVCSTWSECAAPNNRMATEPSAMADRTCAECAAPTLTLEDNESECGLYAFEMTSGEVVIEAENFFAAQARGNAGFARLASTGLSGDACVEVGPDVGTAWTTDPIATAPRLDYRINVSAAGVYYVHIRGDAGASSNAGSDSCYGGVDGTPLQYTFASTGGTWGWSSQSFNIQTAGVHIVSLYGREDGFRADKIVVNNAATPPSGLGPAESAFTTVPEGD